MLLVDHLVSMLRQSSSATTVTVRDLTGYLKEIGKQAHWAGKNLLVIGYKHHATQGKCR